MKNLLTLLISFFIAGTCLFSQEQFNIKPTNGPYGGYIRSFCYDSNRKYIFANADNIYKLNTTTNEWEKQFTELDSLKDHFFTLIYADSIYLLFYVLGEGDMIWGEGFFKSTDKGVSWKDVDKFDKDVRKILSIKNNYLFSDCAYYGGIYRSSDNGETWTNCINGIDTTAKEYSQLEEMTVGDSNYLFLRMYDGGIYRSTNNGDLWQKISDSLPKSQFNSRTYYTAMTVTNEKKLFVSSELGIFRSTDFGDTWVKFVDGLQSFQTYDMDFLKSDEKGNVYATSYSIGIICLKQNDTTWKFINKGLVPNSTNDLFFNISQNEIYAATDGGVYKSTNQGDNWFFYNDGIKIPIEVRSLATAKDVGVFAGTEYNGVYYSSDKGNKWVTVNNGIIDAVITKLKLDSKGNIYAGSDEGHIFKSTNNGSTWDTLSFGQFASNTVIRDLAINSKDYIYIPIAYYYDNNPFIKKLITSKDGGNSWDSIGFQNKYINAITVDNNDNIFIETDSSIYKSSNDGLSWDKVFRFDSLLNVNCFLVTKNNTIFLGTEHNKIFRSIDDGDNWVNLTQGLNYGTSIGCLASPDIDNRIICGSQYDGYYVSLDNGDTWTNYYFPQGGGFPAFQQFRDFAYDGNGTLYAATYNGVYKWDEITSVQPANEEQINDIIYPNPASGFIELPDVLLSKNSKLTIYSTLGTVVYEGSPMKRIDVSSFSAGIYFLKAGDKVYKFLKI